MGHFFLYSVILVAVVGICYYNSLQCGFVFDDMSAIVENRDLKPHVPITNLLWNDFWGTPMKMEKSHKSYRPICVLTFRLNYAFSELEPMSYHLVNALLHGVVCIILMRVCSLFLKSLPSFLSAVLFAVHPIHTEAVTGVVGRAESLSSIFFLSALLSYYKCTGYHGKTNWRWLIFTVILVTIAMFCKEQGITVVGVCCIYEVFIAQRMKFSDCLRILRDLVSGKPAFPQWLRSAVYRTIVLIASTSFMLFARIRVMGAQLPVFTNFDNPASMAPSPSRHLTFNYLLPVNAWLLIHPSEMCCDWTMGTIPLVKSLADHRNIFTIMFYLVFLKFIIFSLKQQGPRSRAIIMSLSFIVLPFIPASNLFFPVGFVIAERILYTPSMGFSILVAMGFHLIIENNRSLRFLAWLSLGAMILAHGAKTITRNEDWKDEYSLFKAGLIVNQNNAKLFNNVGHALEKYEDFDTALKFFRKAARVQPDDIGAHINVGRTYKNLNMSHEAEISYMKAMDLFPPVIPGKSYSARVAPNHLSVFTSLASLISKNESRLQEADMLYRTAISMRPDYTQAYINRGDILLKMGKPKDAQEQYETALRYETDNPDTYYNLGVIHLEQKNQKLAQKYFNQALEVEPDHKQTLFNSAALMQELGDPADIPIAMSRLKKLIKITPNDSKVYFNLGMLSMDERNYNNAEAWFIKAIELDHGFRSALFNLALMLTNDLKRPLDAVPYLKQLIQQYPDHVKAYILMGDINVNVIKDLSEAEKNFEKVLELDPSDIQAKHNLCVVYVEQGNLVRAEKCLTAVHYEAPKEDYIINHLNIVRTRLNKAQEQLQMEHAARAHKETGSADINPTDNMQDLPEDNGERTKEDVNLEAERPAKEMTEKQVKEGQRIEAEKRAKEQQHMDAERLVKEQQRIEAERLVKEQQRIEAEKQAREQLRIDAERVIKEQQRIDAERLVKEQQRIEAERVIKEEQRIEAERLVKEEQRIEAERLIKEGQRIEAERLVKEEQRIEAERLVKEEQRIEAERLVKEQQRIEAERVRKEEQQHIDAERVRKEEQQRIDAERVRKEQQRIDAEMLVKEQQRIEAERQAEQQRIDAERLVKEKQRIEAERVIKEEQRIEAERLVKEEQRIEAERLVKEEQRIAAETQAKEQKILEAEQKAKDKQRVEEELQAKEKERLEAKRQAIEQQRLEAERQAKEHQAKEQKRLKAERQANERQRLEAERQVNEQQRLEVERQAKEQQILEAERREIEQHRLEAERQVKEKKRLEAEHQAKEKERLEAEHQAKELQRLEAEHQAKEKERLEAEHQAKELQRLEAERQAKEQQILEAEHQAKEQQILEAEHQAKEKERLEAEHQAKEKERLEAERQAKELQRLEAERQAKEKERLEAEHQAKEKERLEAEHQAKEKERSEAERQAKELQRLEAEHQAKEKERLEAEHQAKEKERSETERQAKELQRLEAERQAKEDQKLEFERQAKEQQRLEAERQAKEQQRLEAERQAKEQQRLEAELQAKEQQRLEAEHQAKEQQRVEAERHEKEKKRVESEHQVKEQQRLATERQANEQQRLEADRQAKELQRLEIERQAKEQRRAKDEKQTPNQ